MLYCPASQIAQIGLPVGGVPMAPGLGWRSQAPGRPGGRVRPQAVGLGGQRPPETSVLPCEHQVCVRLRVRCGSAEVWMDPGVC